MLLRTFIFALSVCAAGGSVADAAPKSQGEMNELVGNIVPIPGGTYRYFGVEKVVARFYMSENLITRGEFARFVEATHYQTEAEKPGAGMGCKITPFGNDTYLESRASWRNPGFPQLDTHPVVCVSWNDAQAFIRWTEQQSGVRFRLPSADELAYAARARSEFPWGDDPSSACDFANLRDETYNEASKSAAGRVWSYIYHCRDGYTFTSPVGTFKKNAFGLYDMIGNVEEWTDSCAEDAPKGCRQRVIAGADFGGFLTTDWYSVRYTPFADDRQERIGFRLARDAR